MRSLEAPASYMNWKPRGSGHQGVDTKKTVRALIKSLQLVVFYLGDGNVQAMTYYE